MKKSMLLIMLLSMGMMSPAFSADGDVPETNDADVESASGNNSSKIPPDFSSLDTDADGLISSEEFDTYRTNRNNAEGQQLNRPDNISAFSSFDKDKDGFISESELASHAKYSNPGNGTGTLKTEKNKTKNAKSNSSRSSSKSSRSNSNKSDRSSSGSKSNKGGNSKKDR